VFAGEPGPQVPHRREQGGHLGNLGVAREVDPLRGVPPGHLEELATARSIASHVPGEGASSTWMSGLSASGTLLVSE
jgi:hypothetical protein